LLGQRELSEVLLSSCQPRPGGRVSEVAAVTVAVAEADFVLSATLVAVTVNVPVVLGAVYRPADETVPPLAFQLTAVFVVPLTAAVNCWFPPGCRKAERGDTDTDTPVVTTLTVADADFVLSATLVAVTV
jgi:hypothetical protein